MSFLNATLLAGMLAASVPVILHLLARQKPQRVVFPGVTFLTSRLTHQKSRLKIRRWWLLALRILAVVVFALVLARPHIDVSSASSWTTIAVLGFVAFGLIALASVSFSRNLSRGLSWSLLIAAMVALSAFGVGAIAVFASGKVSELRNEQPAAVVILIDNSPGSAWTTGDADSPSRLAVANQRANELLQRLPAGSRVGVIDRSAAPVSFALDLAAARSRLNQFEPLAVVAPIDQRIEAAIELVRTSELTNRHVIVITDLAEPTWNRDVPKNVQSSRLSAAARADVRVSLLDILDDDATVAFNRSLSIPRFVDTVPSAGAAIPISVDVDLSVRSNEQDSTVQSATAQSATVQSATVQLLLYENDSSLPVVRDGETVLPRLRAVDRVSVDIHSDRTTEVVLSLPPLPRGTYHAVIELVGDDSFAWDNRRYLTIDLPEAASALIVGDQPDEAQVIAAALVAPHNLDDPSAPYRIETVNYRDLTAIDWKPFDLVVMIDPPVHYDSTANSWVGSPDGLSTAMLEQLTDRVAAGAGLLISLGPSTQLVNSSRVASDTGTASLLPKLVRVWRVPEPGTFFQVSSPPHPMMEPLTRPSTRPNWSDFRVRRFWQTEPLWQPELQSDPAGDWNVVATLAQRSETSTDDADEGNPRAAILTRSFEQGRIAVTTTPLPALGPVTRTWNDLFTSSDAWPAFVTVRNASSWLVGSQSDPKTLLVGQTALLRVDTAPSEAKPIDAIEPGQWQVFPSGRLPFKPQLQSVAESEVLSIRDLSTPGTYFLRRFDISTTKTTGGGVSANLPVSWSSSHRVEIEDLEKWFDVASDQETGDQRESRWAITDDVDEISLVSDGSGSGALALHGPLMLLAVFVFVGEQLLSNHFYGNDRRLAKPDRAFVGAGG
ncbi:BatA domain-containing protein [Neorhodopirellula pilleata]|uniref:Aerotolerance regulator N-terminal domain-containing protein n=1 Tax=Neorhodopirellula pilleata TaxID=2714738 RepID=A0A5C6A6I8_9BACT|nr:BatA domain-containing protein [Neorhodopirellula pilleata]TWT95010.1 hypothetical protein Pla100_35890 [Neorhodopirellula pilleata]